MTMLALIVSCGLLIGAVAGIFRARRASRAAISEAELDRRLARLHRSECAPTDEERRRRAANLQAILAGEPLIRAPRPAPQPKDHPVHARPSGRPRRIHARFWPEKRTIPSPSQVGLGLTWIAISCGSYLTEMDPSREAVGSLGLGLAMLVGYLSTRGLRCPDQEAGRMADLPAEWPVWRRYLHSVILHHRHPVDIDEPAERVRHSRRR
jgi:hypothetical protein